jgi:fumarate hydratase subunit beta
MEKGLRGMIGKGKRNDEVKKSMKKNGAVYFAAVGGAGALISQCITSVKVIAWEDLGPEAVRRLEVKDMPLIVVNDTNGGDLYAEGVAKYRRKGDGATQ